MTALRLERLDADRRRRRIRLLAELAEAQTLRDRIAPRRARMERLRELISSRQRLT